MSSTPVRKSAGSDLACSARSKLSITGNSDLMASTVAKSRKSCCSLAARRRAFSNSAWARARRSSSVSRSAFTFCNSALEDSTAPGEASAVGAGGFSSPSAGGSSRSRSSAFVSDFPFDFPITAVLLRFIQDFVEQARNVRNSRDGVLIVHPGGPDYSQRAHDFVSGMSRRADQHEILHRGQGLIKTDDHADRLLLDVEISAEKLYHLFLFLELLKHFLQALAILLTRNQICRAFNEYHLRALLGGKSALLVKLLDRVHQAIVFAA